jgi:hypothetical protein
MEHIHNNLMKLGGLLGNVPQKLKKTCYKNSIYFRLLVHFQGTIKHDYIISNDSGLGIRWYKIKITIKETLGSITKIHDHTSITYKIKCESCLRFYIG